MSDSNLRHQFSSSRHAHDVMPHLQTTDFYRYRCISSQSVSEQVVMALNWHLVFSVWEEGGTLLQNARYRLVT